MQVSELAIQGLKFYISDLFDNKPVEFSFRAVVDQIMAFQTRQQWEVRRRIAVEGIIAEGLWQVMMKLHFVSRGQPASFGSLKELAEEIVMMPSVLIKAIARFVAT
jgi:uncharacterized membrane protein YpjA